MFFPLGAMLSGDPTRSFQQSADNKLNFEGMQAAGKALQLAQGGTPPTAQTSFLGNIFGGGGGGGAPSMTGQSPASPASPGMPPAGAPPPGPQAGMPQQPAPTPQPAMSPMGPGGGAGSPITSWQTALRMVAQANPGAPPAVIAAGAQHLLKTIGPGLQQDAMTAYRMGSLGERSAHDVEMERILRQRADTAEHRAEQPRTEPERWVAEDPANRTLQQFYEMKAEAGRAGKGPTATEQKAQERQGQIRDVLTTVDDALKGIGQAQAGGPSVTGVGGTIQRGREFIEGVLPEGVGVGPIQGAGPGQKTPATAFQQQIRIIQEQWPRLRTGVGRISNQEREHLDQIIGGLGRFTSPQQAQHELQYVRGKLQDMLKDPERAPSGSRAPSGQRGAQPAGAGPPASMLKEGIGTHFDNGQVWTLQNGKPVQVQ